MKVTKAVTIQYILQQILKEDLTGNEVKVAIGWLCDSWDFHPTAKQIASRCGISEPAAQAALKGLSTKQILLSLGKVLTPNGKLKNTFTFGPIFNPEKLIEGKYDAARAKLRQNNEKPKKFTLLYVEKWPHIQNEAERLVPVVQRHFSRLNSVMKKLAKLQGFRSAIATQIQNQDFKHIDFKIANFNQLGNELVNAVNEHVAEHDLPEGLFPRFEQLPKPKAKKKRESQSS